MKRLIAAILAVVLVLTMVACGNTPADNPTTDPTSPSQTEGTKPDGTVPDPSTEPSGEVNDPSSEVTEPTDEVTEPTTAPSEPTENPTVPTDPAHEHSYTTAVTAPTCTKDGYTTYTCSCGESYVADQVNATGHSYTTAVTAPTCTAEGYTTYTCACGNSHVSDKVNPKGHSYGAWVTVKEPTTSATGKAERKCATCSAKEERTLDKIIANHTHSYTSSVTKQPTCTAQGVKTYTCSCGGSYTESIERLGHDYSKTKVTAPTCTSEGYTTHTCSRCSDSYKDAYTNKTSHNNTAKVTAPTCTAQGYTTYTCSKCGNSSKGNYTPAKGHTKQTVKGYAATCTKSGLTDGVTCSVCKATVTAQQTIPAKGHDWKNATCTSPKTCKTCGTTEGKALGHNWKSATCTTPKTCSTCGTTSGNANGHSYANGSCVNCGQAQPACTHKNTKTEKVASTCSTQGYEKVICKDCGKTISNTKLPIGKCSFTKTMNLAEAAAKYFDDTFDTEFSVYEAYTDWLVNVCPGCGYLDIDSRRPAHSAIEEAQIMLDYVNDLREDTYGTSAWNMKLDAKLVELAKIRAKELANNESQRTYTNATENMCAVGVSIKTHFNAWKNSSGHCTIMKSKTFEYFGYARYEAPSGAVYAVQLFWSEGTRDNYYMVIEEG